MDPQPGGQSAVGALWGVKALLQSSTQVLHCAAQGKACWGFCSSPSSLPPLHTAPLFNAEPPLIPTRQKQKAADCGFFLTKHKAVGSLPSPDPKALSKGGAERRPRALPLASAWAAGSKCLGSSSDNSHPNPTTWGATPPALSQKCPALPCELWGRKTRQENQLDFLPVWEIPPCKHRTDLGWVFQW